MVAEQCVGLSALTQCRSLFFSYYGFLKLIRILFTNTYLHSFVQNKQNKTCSDILQLLLLSVQGQDTGRS